MVVIAIIVRIVISLFCLEKNDKRPAGLVMYRIKSNQIKSNGFFLEHDFT